MGIISIISAILCMLCLVAIPITLIVWIVMGIRKSERKKRAKWAFLGAIAGFFVFTIIGTSTQCNHEWEIVEQVNVTCVEDGFQTKRCIHCGTEGKVEVIPATGHTFAEETVQEATCASTGLVEKTCSVCKETESIILEKAEHSYEEKTVQEATCAVTGLVEKTCSVCNKTESIILEKTEHSYELVATKAATLEAGGEEEWACTVCGDVQKKALERLGSRLNPGKITVEELVAEINANKDAAKAKYNGQWIEITGKVLDADNVAGMTRFYLYGEFGGSGLRIVCWVNEDMLKPFEYQGEVHTFLGQVREITTVNATEIGDCQIISD